MNKIDALNQAKLTKARLAMTGISLAAIAWAQAAHAQSVPVDASAAEDPAATAAPEAAQPAESRLGEIVVTAQRRNQNLQNVPASITAISAAQIEAKSIQTGYDLKLVSPSVSVNAPMGEGSAPLYTIRGIGAGDYLLNQSRPVPTYLNGAVRSLAGFDFVPIYDVDRIEILNGPQGALYGKNAVGGVVNIITKEAGFDPGGYITVGYGNYDRREARGAAQTTLIDDVLAVRAAFMVQKANGWAKNNDGVTAREGIDVVSGRLSLLFRPSSEFQANLVVHRSTSDGTGTNVYTANDSAIGDYQTGAVPRTKSTPFYNDSTELEGQGIRIRNTGINLNMRYDFGAFSAYSVTGYDTGSYFYRQDDDATAYPGTNDVYASPNMKSLYQEVRLQSNGDSALKWLVGGYYGWDKTGIDYNFQFNFLPYIFNVNNTFTQSRNSYAAFGRLEYDITPELNVFGGIRYSHDKVVGRDLSVRFGDTQPFTFDTVLFTGASNRVTAHNTSFEAGVNYKPTTGVLLYGSFKQGYRGPALNSQVASSPDEFSSVDPETLDAFEIGAKTQLVDWLRVNVAAFHYNYDKQQYFGQVTAPSGGYISRLSNVGSTRIKGVDWTIEAAPVEGLSLGFSGSYLDAKYRDTVISGVDVSGNRAIYSPKWSLGGTADVRLVTTDAGNLNLHGDVSYQSSVFFTANNTTFVKDDGRTLVNSRLSWTADEDRWTAGLWVKNLFKEHYFVTGFESAASFGFDQLYRGAPRTFGADVTFKF